MHTCGRMNRPFGDYVVDEVHRLASEPPFRWWRVNRLDEDRFFFSSFDHCSQ